MDLCLETYLGEELQFDVVCGLLCERFAGEGKLGGCDVELQVGFGDIRYGECEVYEVFGWVGRARALGPEDCNSVSTASFDIFSFGG